LTSNFEGPFDFVGGLYYYTEDIDFDSQFAGPNNIDVSTDAIAIFFQSTYDLTDTLTLTTGARYTDETKDMTGVSATQTRVQSADFTNTTGTLALHNQFSEDVMGYVSFSTGFKGGGWSPDCGDPNACYVPVDEEELTSFEFGLRSDLLDKRLRLNVTFFFNTYENLQIGATAPIPGQVDGDGNQLTAFTRFNVNESEISGLEIESSFIVTEALTLNFTLGTLDAKYTDVGPVVQAGGLTNNGAAPGCNGIASSQCAQNLELKNAPEYKGTLGAVYVTSIAGGELTAGLDVEFEDDSFSLAANPQHSVVNPDPLVNARLAYQPDVGDWRVSVWGRNLTDEEYARQAIGQNLQFAAEPMTWGIDVGYTF